VGRRANELDGRTWTRHSISIWGDLKKSAEEMALRHPAQFPAALPARLIDCFTTATDRLVFDPFAGIGSTLLAAAARGKEGVGIELSEEFAAVARRRCEEQAPGAPLTFHVADARNLLVHLAPGSVDLLVTSPPYWDILHRKRTADYKAIRHYGDAAADLGKIADYDQFLDSLQEVFAAALVALRPGAYCCVVVMDVRKKAEFYPLHSDLAARLRAIGYRYDDLIIWDRRHEYNSLRPLGYPAVFRINKAHEYILIFQKPPE
jgi:DNA modification methylase